MAILQKFSPKQKSKFLIALLISYLSIFIVPLFLSLGVYYVSYNTIKNFSFKTQEEIIKNVKTIIDKELETVSRLGVRVAFDSKVSQLIFDVENNEDENIVTDIMEIQKMLSSNMMTDNIAEEIYLYLPKAGFVLTRNNKYSLEEFSQLVGDFLNCNENELFGFLNNKNWKNFILIGDNATNKSIVFLQSIPDSSYQDICGTVIIKLNSDKISELIKSSIDTEKYIIGIVDQNNSFYLSGRKEFIKLLNLSYTLFSKHQKPFMLLSKNGQKFCVVHFSSANSKWEYFSVFSLSLLMKEITYIRRIIFIYLLICCLIGFTLITKFLKKNYSPVKTLVERVCQQLKINRNVSDDEFRFLDNILENIISQNKKLTDEVNEKQLRLLENIFIRLLKEKNSYRSKIAKYVNSLNVFGLREPNRLVLIGVSIKEISDKIFKIAEREEEIELVYLVIKNVLNEILIEKYKSYVLEVDGRIVALSMGIDVNEYTDFLSEKLSYMSKFLEEKFGLKVLVGISRVYEKIEMISLAYEDLNDIFEYVEISNPNTTVIFFEDIGKEEMSTTNGEILDYLKRIIECISVHDYKSLRDNNTKLVEIIKENSQNSPNMRYVYFNTYKSVILNIYLKYISKLNKDYLEIIKNTNNINTLVQIFDEIIKILEKSENSEDKKPYWLDEVIAYVNENYSSKDLSVDIIADKFNISSAHLSRTFKKFTGVNLSDYIHTVRIEKVKNLLENSNYSVKEIAEMTGYLDSKALIRVFKNYVGTTPSKYREEIRKNKQLVSSN